MDRRVKEKQPTSAMMKLALMRTTTGMEDPELPLLQRIRSLELPASEIAVQINASQSSSNRHISTSTVLRRLRESSLHGQIAAKKPLKDTCYFIVLMSSLLIYNVENSKTKEKPLNE